MINFVSLLLARLALASAGGMLIPYLYTLNFEHGEFLPAFSYSIFISLAVAIVLFAKGEQPRPEKLSVTGGATFICVSWIAYAILGSFPYALSGIMPFDDAIMECFSGFTTTGLTFIPVDLPNSIILWRSITQWLGGLHILLILAAIIPAVTKGFGIYFAMPVNLRNTQMTLKHINKSTFKITAIYILITLLGLLMLYLSGLHYFDALNFVMVIISTGGCYTPHEELKLNLWVYVIISFGLIVSCLNVLVYFQSSSFHQVKNNFINRMRSMELQYFLGIIFICSTVIGANLYINNSYELIPAITQSFFYVASFASTTGILVEKIYSWPDINKMILMLLPMLGGCMGSMAGGFKMLRVIILTKTTIEETRRTLHPHMVLNLKVDNGSVPIQVVNRVLSFFFLYCVILFFSMMVISLSGCTMHQAMFIAIGCLTSTGQLISLQFNAIDIYNSHVVIKMICCFLMILGKVEFISFLILIQFSMQKLRHKIW